MKIAFIRSANGEPQVVIADYHNREEAESLCEVMGSRLIEYFDFEEALKDTSFNEALRRLKTICSDPREPGSMSGVLYKLLNAVYVFGRIHQKSGV